MEEYLTTDYLTSMGFIYNETSPFDNISLPYYAKDSVLMFFNKGEHNKHVFYIGYGDCFFGKYSAVTFRWINSKVQLHDIFRAVKGKELIKEAT